MLSCHGKEGVAGGVSAWGVVVVVAWRWGIGDALAPAAFQPLSNTLESCIHGAPVAWLRGPALSADCCPLWVITPRGRGRRGRLQEGTTATDGGTGGCARTSNFKGITPDKVRAAQRAGWRGEGAGGRRVFCFCGCGHPTDRLAQHLLVHPPGVW